MDQTPTGETPKVVDTSVHDGLASVAHDDYGLNQKESRKDQLGMADTIASSFFSLPD